jgi:ribosomal-protein-alanine N-acetyltransferase
VKLRALNHTDLPRVMSIERRAFTSPWSPSMFVLELSKPSEIALAVVDADQLVGYLVCAQYPEAFHIMSLAVDPERRRQGIARMLLDGVIDRGGADADYTLEVRVSNTPAITLYERYGFRGVGTRPRYYADNGEDAIIMWRSHGRPWEPR